MPSEKPSMLKWKNLDGQQKYKVVELARKKETSVTELCLTFGVCRQTLYRAMDMADTAATEALSPKKRGRPKTSPTQKEIQELHDRNKELEQRLKRQEMKNQVAMALLDLHRKADRGEKLPGEKKTSR